MNKLHFDKPVTEAGANGFIGLRLVDSLVVDGHG